MTVSASLQWSSISEHASQALLAMDFSGDPSYEFDLAWASVQYQNEPIVPRSLLINLDGPYDTLTVLLDNQTYTYVGQNPIAINTLRDFSHVKITCAASIQPQAVVYIFDDPEAAAVRERVVGQQNKQQIDSIQTTVLDLEYSRMDVYSLATATAIVSKGSNKNGIRIDYINIGTSQYYHQLFAYKGAGNPSTEGYFAATGNWRRLAFVSANASGTIFQFQNLNLPIIVPAHYALYEWPEDTVNFSWTICDYHIL